MVRVRGTYDVQHAVEREKNSPEVRCLLSGLLKKLPWPHGEAGE